MKTILVVEDDEKLAMVLSLRLKQGGYRVLTAHDAIAAMSHVMRDQPDLIVLDVMMPGGGGLVVAERVQKQVPRSIPLIFTTGSTEDEILQQALAMHPVAYFEKPYDGEQVVATVQAALGDVGQRRHLVAASLRPGGRHQELRR